MLWIQLPEVAEDYWRWGRQVSQWNDQFEDTCFFDSSNDALFSRTVSSSIFPRAAIARRDCKTISFLIASLGCIIVSILCGGCSR